jgi:dienelactone hydrolase
LLAVLLGGAACGCNSTDATGLTTHDASMDAEPPPVRAVFDPGRLPMPFGAVPWPDNAYLDEMARVRVRDIPSSSQDGFGAMLAEAMADLDGFAVRPTIYFTFDGALDPGSLPQEAQATLEPDASVFLLDADTSSPEAFERIAVDVRYDAAEQRVALRPAFFRALHPGRLYAAVVTRRVESEDGRAVDGAQRFLRIRDAQLALADPLDRAARVRYAPLLEALAAQGVAHQRVVALAVFRVQSLRDDLADARVLLRQTPPGPPTITDVFTAGDLDGVLGAAAAGTVGLDESAPHEHIGWMLHGRFESPNFLSSLPGGHGVFERNETGELRIKRTDDVPFSLLLPRGLASGGALPVVVVQHGRGSERSDSLALANALASSGYAVLAADAPFHGLRSAAGDTESRFTGAREPDGFGDAAGDFEGIADEDGELVALHPFYFRDVMQQGVADLLQLVFVVQQGDWSALQELDPELEQLELDVERIGYVGLGLGADLGVMLASAEPEIAAMALAFAEGSTLDGWLQSPARGELIDALWARLALGTRDADDAAWLPDVDAWRALADRGNSAAHAPAVRRRPVNLFMPMARDDEVAHNSGTEALAHALGAVVVGGEPRYVTQLDDDQLRPGAALSANLAVEGGAVTRVLYVLDPATHGALTLARDRVRYEHPLSAPFIPLDSPGNVDNPIAESLMQVAFFFESYRACLDATPAALCAASVMAPTAATR